MPRFQPNEQQKQAIEHVGGPMLVVAGAGTGKTTVLVERITRLIAGGHARPDEILAVTYTNNAADELRSRVGTRLVELGILTGAEITASTFHAYCYELLWRSGRAFNAIDDKDLYVYLGRRLPELALEYYTRAVNPGEFVNALTDFFSRCHDELVTAPEYYRYVERLRAGERPLPRVVPSSKAEEIREEEVLARCAEIARVYETVERMLAADGLGTFGHMVLRSVQALRAEPALRAAERRRAKFVLIDEFQDANFVQIELAALLAGEAGNVFAVGDPDQAIYRFRGASNAAFEEFSRRWPSAAGVVLGENQRSHSSVLRCAFAVIDNNPPARCRVGPAEFARVALESARDRARGTKGAPALVEVVICAGDTSESADIVEARHVADRIADLGRSRPADPNKPRFGVLYRSHANREQVMRELYERGIKPYVTGVNALDTAEVRDLLACLRAIADPVDAESLLRAAALPVFDLEAETVREALRSADAPLEVVLRRVPGGAAVLSAVQQARDAAAKVEMKPDAVIADVLRRFRFAVNHPAIAALRKFVAEWKKKPAAIIGDGGLAAFLEYMDWFQQAQGCVEAEDARGDDPSAPRLMTAHAAKGLEFEHVFVLRANTGSFPTGYRERLFEFPAALRRSESAPGDSSEVHRQEERRLFYVAMTRARESLTLCTRPGRGKQRRPAGFVRELLDDRASSTFRREVTVVPPPQRGFDLAASAAGAGISAWLMMAPSARLLSPVLSASAIETYEKCPLHFKLDRDWKIPGAPAAAMQYGNVVHLVLKDYYDAMRVRRPRSVDDALQLFQQLLSEAYFDDEHQRELYRRQGEKQITEFLSTRAQEPPPAIEQTEWPFQIKIAGVPVRGRVDRIDRIADGIAVIDYKTGKARKQRDADESLQLSLYAIATETELGQRPGQLIIYNLEDGSAVLTSRNEAALEQARERVRNAAEGIAAGDFEPSPDRFNCRWCEYRNLCPATEQKLYMNGGSD